MTAQTADKFLYYQCLADLVWPGYDRVLRTTAWALLDKQASSAQKAEALAAAAVWEQTTA